MSTEDRSAQARFGTFGGVFTPCCLTILGVIMFMRSGYVVGDIGLWGAIVILAIAKAITTLTTLSLSAIATNTEVRTGGVYYMISRTLGPDFGGAIGLTLFVSQAVSIAFYVIGFSEAFMGLFAPADMDLKVFLAQNQLEQQLLSSAIIVVLFFVTFKGADLAMRAQYVILAVLLVAVLVAPMLERGEAVGAGSSAADRLDLALDALREIEFEHETGKISDEDYATLRQRHAADAIAARDGGATLTADSQPNACAV